MDPELAAKLSALTDKINKADNKTEVKETHLDLYKTPLQEKQEILKEFGLESNIPIHHRYWKL